MKIRAYTSFEAGRVRKPRDFEIVTDLPEVGDYNAFRGELVEAVKPVQLDCEQGSDAVYDYDYYEVVVRYNYDPDPEYRDEAGELVESSWIAIEREPAGMVVNASGALVSFDAAVELMDDEVRERVHDQLAPCSDQEFFTAYEAAHAEAFGEDWGLSGPNPVY